MASHPICQFYTELKDYKPKIWRRFQVLDNISMARFGYILMTMYEMQASHMFAINVYIQDIWKKYYRKIINISDPPGKTTLRYEIDPEQFDEFGGDETDAVKTRLNHVLKHHVVEKMVMEYDFGDGWEIEAVLESTIEDENLPGRELPRVLEGEGYGIIEDCGGSSGLMRLTKAYKLKKGKEYEEYRDWLGRDELDLTAFDIDDMNLRLKKVPRIYRDIYELELEPTKQSLDFLERKYKQNKKR